MGKNKKITREDYNLNRNILIDDYKFIYFFIPKNGCTTFKKHLLNSIGEENYLGPIHKFNFSFAPIEQVNVGYPNYMKFAIVRNPWSRLVSCYNNKIRSLGFTNGFFLNGVHRGFRRFGELFYGDMPFNEFVDAVCSIPDSKADGHFISQLYWLTDFSGELLPNYIGRLENLDIAIEDIHQKTGLSLYNMEHKNKSRISTPYTEYYDENLKEKVREKFAVDIEVFGYEFEPYVDITQIGFVDDAFRERLAKSKYLLPILKEKCAELEMNHKKERGRKNERIAVLEEKLASSNKNLTELQAIANIENSFSWKITAPMRRVASFLKIKS